MTRIITKEEVYNITLKALKTLPFELPEDIRKRLDEAYEKETKPRAKQALDVIRRNYQIAAEDKVAICQDTGFVWVCLEIGPDVCIQGDVMQDVNKAVALAYEEGHLRKSIVRDALIDRSNTNDNTPAFTDVVTTSTPGARLHIMCKGGGSDNASHTAMLTPSAGKQGIIDEIVSWVEKKAPNACPPLILGVGVGGTFGRVTSLAKVAFMRPLGNPNPIPEIQAFEDEIKEAVNSTGIGAAALGGDITALGVHVVTGPCHIAALPLAINMGCSATRRGTYEL